MLTLAIFFLISVAWIVYLSIITKIASLVNPATRAHTKPKTQLTYFF